MDSRGSVTDSDVGGWSVLDSVSVPDGPEVGSSSDVTADSLAISLPPSIFTAL